VDFEWDDANRGHILYEATWRFPLRYVHEVSNNDPVLVENEPAPGRSGSHKMIGPLNSGAMWTVVLLHRHGDLWRPVTGWPSTNTEILIWKEATEDHD
jgi:hypothetical protein